MMRIGELAPARRDARPPLARPLPSECDQAFRLKMMLLTLYMLLASIASHRIVVSGVSSILVSEFLCMRARADMRGRPARPRVPPNSNTNTNRNSRIIF